MPNRIYVVHDRTCTATKRTEQSIQGLKLRLHADAKKAPAARDAKFGVIGKIRKPCLRQAASDESGWACSEWEESLHHPSRSMEPGPVIAWRYGTRCANSGRAARLAGLGGTC